MRDAGATRPVPTEAVLGALAHSTKSAAAATVVAADVRVAAPAGARQYLPHFTDRRTGDRTWCCVRIAGLPAHDPLYLRTDAQTVHDP